jgi:hypothetical protein
VLSAARHKTRREVERIVAALRPLPPVPSSVRKLPTPAPRPTTAWVGESAARDTGRDDHRPPEPTVQRNPPASPRPAVVTPLAPERYKIQVTVSRATHDKLRRAQDLLRRSRSHPESGRHPQLGAGRRADLAGPRRGSRRRAARRLPGAPGEAGRRAGAGRSGRGAGGWRRMTTCALRRFCRVAGLTCVVRRSHTPHDTIQRGCSRPADCFQRIRSESGVASRLDIRPILSRSTAPRPYNRAWSDSSELGRDD